MDETYVPEELLQSIVSYIPGPTVRNVSKLFRELESKTEDERIELIFQRYGDDAIHAFLGEPDVVFWLLQYDFPITNEDIFQFIDNNRDDILIRFLAVLHDGQILVAANYLLQKGRYSVVDKRISQMSLSDMEDLVEMPYIDESEYMEDIEKYISDEIYLEMFISMLKHGYEPSDRILYIKLDHFVWKKDLNAVKRIYQYAGDDSIREAIYSAMSVKSYDFVIRLIKEFNYRDQNVINGVTKEIAGECKTDLISQLIDLGANNYDEIAKILSRSGKCRCVFYQPVYSETLQHYTDCKYDKQISLKLLNLGYKNYRYLSKFIGEELISGGYITLDQYELYKKQREFDVKRIEF